VSLSLKKFKVDPKLQRALDNFPEIVREQARNFKAKEKDIKRFEKLSRQLEAMAAKKKSRNS